MLSQEPQQLRRVAGQLNWVSTQLRPDMAHAVNVISSSVKDATVKEIITANKIIKILKSKDIVFSFAKTDDISKAALICFNDTSFANLKCGLFVFLEVSDRRYMLLAWQS